MPTKRRLLVVLLWLVTVLETLLMLVAGSAKFTNAELWQGMFLDWGYPVWFTSVVGTLEMTGAISLLVPRIAAYAALGLIVIMLGALGTVLINQSELGWFGPVLHMSFLATIVVLRLKVLRSTTPSP